MYVSLMVQACIFGIPSFMVSSVKPSSYFHFRKLSENISEDDITSLDTSVWILFLAFSLFGLLLICCCYQLKKQNVDEFNYRVIHCGGCGRAYRLPPTIEVESFMCATCVSEGRRPRSVVEEEERNERLDKMEHATTRNIRLEKLGSTFFRILRGETNRIERQKSLAMTKAFEESSADECKICYADHTSMIILPCGHGGLCQGCTKDLIHHSKECYICRGPIEFIAEIKRKDVWRSHDEEGPEKFVAEVVGPSQLHHKESRVAESSVADLELPRSHD